MADQKRRIEIELAANADSVVEASRLAERAFQRVIDQTKAAGRDTSALEQQLEELKRESAASWVDAYVAGLDAYIAKEREAGRATADLEAGLDRIRGSASAASQEFDRLQAQAAKGGGEFNFKTVSKGELAEALRATEAQAGFLDRLRGSFSGVAAQFPVLGRIGSAVGALATGPIALLAGGVGAIVAGWRGARAALTAYLADSERMAQLDGSLAQQGLLVDRVRRQYIGLATELQRVTAIADDQWLDVLRRLTQFGARPQSIGIDVETVKNLAAVFNGNLNQATLAYGRALQGVFSQFSELGIQIDENLTQTEKLAQLQRIAAERGSGVLEAGARSLGGQFKQLRNEISDTAEGFGRLLFQNTATRLALEFLRAPLQALTEVLPDAAAKTEGLTNRQRSLAESSRLTVDALRRIGEQARATADKDLERLGAQIDRLQERFARGFDTEQARLRQQQQLAEAQLALELKRLEIAEKRGEISAPVAAERRFALTQQQASGQESVERRARELEIEAALKKLSLEEEKLTKDFERPRDAAQADVAQGERALQFLDEVRNRFLQQIDEAQRAGTALTELRGQREKEVTAAAQFTGGDRERAAQTLSVQDLDAKIADLQSAFATAGRETINQLVARLTEQRDAARADAQTRGADPRSDALTIGAQQRLDSAQRAQQSGNIDVQREALQAEYDRQREALEISRARLKELDAAVAKQAAANERLEAALGDRVDALHAEQRTADEIARLQREAAAIERDAARQAEARAAERAQLGVEIEAAGRRLVDLATRLATSKAAAADDALAQTISALEQQARTLADGRADPAALAAAEEQLRTIYLAAAETGAPLAGELQQLGNTVRVLRENLATSTRVDQGLEALATELQALTRQLGTSRLAGADAALARSIDALDAQARELATRGGDPEQLAAAEENLRQVYDAARRQGAPVADDLQALGRALRAFRETLEGSTAAERQARQDRAASPPPIRPGRTEVDGRTITPPAPAPTPVITPEELNRRRAHPTAATSAPPAPPAPPDQPATRPSGQPAVPAVTDVLRDAATARQATDALQEAAAALKAAAADLRASAAASLPAATGTPTPRRATGGRVREDEETIVTDAPGSPPEIFVPDDPAKPAQKLTGSGAATVFTPPADGTIVPADQAPRASEISDPQISNQPAAPKAAPTPRAEPTPRADRTPTAADPVDDGVIRSNQQARDAQDALNRSKGFAPPEPVIRSSAEARERSEQRSAAFRADPANAPRPPAPPTPPKPAGDDRTNAAFKADFQRTAAAQAAAQKEALDAALGAVAHGQAGTQAAIRQLGDKLGPLLAELIELQRNQRVA